MSAPNKLPEDDVALAAEYALGVLQGSERHSFEKRLADDPALAAELRQWDERLMSLGDQVSPVAPPPQLWSKIDTRLFGSRQTDSKPTLWNSLTFWRGLAFASVLGVLVSGLWTLRPAQNQANEVVFAQVTGEAAKLKLAVVYDADSGQLRFNRLEGAPNTGRSHELWLISGSEPPVSLGVLPADVAYQIQLTDVLKRKLVGSVLAVSDEPLGGSPTGAPTGAVLATGLLTKV